MPGVFGPVSERALFGRINRALKHDGMKLHKCPEGSSAFSSFGRWYLKHHDRNFVARHHIDLQHFAREIGVMGEREYLEATSAPTKDR